MKKRIFCYFLILILLFSVLCSCSGSKKNKYTAHSMEYFDTVITITGYERNKEDFDKTSKEILDLFSEYHQLYSIYHRFDNVNNLCTINDVIDGAHPTLKVDRRIIDLLKYSKEMYTLTNGVTNIALGSVLSLWHDYRTIGKDDPDNAALPPMELLKTASMHTDISKIVIDEVNSTVTITDPQVKLDVGAIAKGYAVERVAKTLEEKGINNYVLNVGGNVRTIGSKADGTKWTVGIENPDGDDYLAYLSLSGESLVTSGSYQRFYYVDGKSYHHIIHPDTLMPAKGYLSVSVLCKDSGLADALSTALFCMSIDDGLELVESLEGVEAMWLTEDKNETFSSGWKNYEKEA